jgi:hypothetical protein
MGCGNQSDVLTGGQGEPGVTWEGKRKGVRLSQREGCASRGEAERARARVCCLGHLASGGAGAGDGARELGE